MIDITDSIASAVQTAAIGGAVLIAGVAVFQLALALGLPLGEAVFGGRAPSVDGVLTKPFRALAAGQAVVLSAVGWTLLARAGITTLPFVTGPVLVGAVWAIVAFLALNTLGNLAAPHPVERWVMGSITLVLSGIALLVALRGPALR